MRIDHWVLAKFQAFRKDEEGASAIEYALIAAMVALALVTLSGDIGTKISNIFTEISTGLGD